MRHGAACGWERGRPGRSAVTLALLFLVASPAAALQKLYVANISGGTVAVVDAERRLIIDRVAVGREPDGVAAAADGSAVYVSNFADGTVSVIDPTRDTVVATIAVDPGPVGLAVHPDGHEVYVACKLARTLVVIDAVEQRAVASIPIGQTPNAVVVSPTGHRAYVARSSGSTITVVDIPSRSQRALLDVGQKPNRLALSADGRTLYVAHYSGSLRAVDLRTGGMLRETYGTGSGVDLATDGTAIYSINPYGGVTAFTPDFEIAAYTCAGVTPYDVLALSSGAVVVADMQGDGLHFLDRRLGAAQRLAVDGGPFAVAALPPREAALDLALESPLAGTRAARGETIEVRITAGAGSQPLQNWLVALIPEDGTGMGREIAAGTSPVASAVVATLAADDLTPGLSHRLELVGLGTGGASERRTAWIQVPDRQVALVPLESYRPNPYSAGYAMDGSGRRFVRINDTGDRLLVFDADAAQFTRVDAPAGFNLSRVEQLSRDGERVALSAFTQSGVYATGLFDLDTRIFSLVPSLSTFDLDRGGDSIATLRRRDHGWNYDLIDVSDGLVTPITDLPTLDDNPPTCRPFTVGRPRLSADGNTVAFFTTHPLGGPPGCNLYDWRRGDTQPRVVQAFGDGGPVHQPTMDDLGRRVAALFPPEPSDAGGPLRAGVVELDDGATTLLDTDGIAVLDAVLSGDGAAVTVSSCGDLDPRVGNPDFSLELFRIALIDGRITQLTDTRGGPQDCTQRGDEPLSPQVSADGAINSFRPGGFGALRCGNPGVQRDAHTGLAFGQVRAVPIDPDNAPPALSGPDRVVAVIGSSVRVDVEATDPDGDPVVFFADFDDTGELPHAARFSQALDVEPRAAIFVWDALRPGNVGLHALRIGAFDGRGGDDVLDVRIAVCRFVAEDGIGDVVTAIFGSQPADCGTGDVNGDGIASAADLVDP